MKKALMICLISAAVAFMNGCTATSTASADSSADTKNSLTDVQVLSQSITDHGFTVVWNGSEDTSTIKDYLVTIETGQKKTQVQASTNPSVAAEYINAFYENGTGDLQENGKIVEKAKQILQHAYTLKDLLPGASYQISVQIEYADGSLSDAQSVTASTAEQADASTILNVESCGAVGDGVLADDAAGTVSSGTLNTVAIQEAIDQCPENGTVLIPAGKIFLCGPIQLKSNLTLDVEGTLLATADASQYSNPYDSNSSATGEKSASFISAEGKLENIRIIGSGTIDGNGWCTVSGRKNAKEDFPEYASGKDSNIAKTGAGHLSYAQFERYCAQGDKKAYACRSNLLSLSGIDHLYVGDGITLSNPSMHTLSISKCSNTVVNNAIFSTYNCNNGDGIDYSASTSPFIVVNSVFNTGDDGVCFAATKETTGHAWIFDNYFGRGHAVIALGSNTNEGIEDVTAEDNVASGTGVGLRGKSQYGNGGGAWNIIFRNSALANITDNDGIPFMLTNDYSAASKTGNNGAPCFHDISVSNCTVNGAKKAFISVTGTAKDAAGTDYNITMENLSFVYDSTCADSMSANTSILKNVKDSTFKNIRIYGVDPKWDLEKDTLANVEVEQ